MIDKTMTSQDHSNNEFDKLLPAFIGEIIDASGDFVALSAASAKLCSCALELQNTNHSIAVFIVDSSGISNKYDSCYFSSNVVSEDEFQPVINTTINHLTENPVNNAKCYNYPEIINDNTGEAGNPVSLLVVPICISSEICGYTVVFYHDNDNPHTVDDPQVKFISKVMYLIALAVHCELNDAILEHYMMSDNLTELPNRDHVYEAIKYILQTTEAFSHRFALMVIRFNGLKYINNSLGIRTGDLLIKSMGALIEKSVSSSTDNETLIGRLSGGNFIALITLPSVNCNENDDKDVISKCCRAIAKEADRNIEINGYKMHPSTNIGVSIYPTHGETAEELLRKADLAKNDSKNAGPGTFSIYKSFMDGDAEEVLFLNSNLPTAISLNQFEMFYQAMADVSTGKIIAAEALIRWKHPERGFIKPDSFIPFAEKNAYAVHIDKLVLDMVCNQIVLWQEKGIDLVVSINVSPRHFINGLIYESVRNVLEEFNLEPSRLRIELLENVLLEDFNAVVRVIENLRSLGVGIALDDFGSGYSSLDYVSRLPLDFLKTDGTFMINMENNPNNKIIMETILTLAKGMGVKAVAEGVERKEDFDFLRSIDFDVAQGSFVNEPMDVEAFEGFLKNWNLD